jgi:hypothetical protein
VKRRILASCVAAACLAGAPSAGASVTIGQVFTPTAQTTATLAQTGTANTSYTIPSDGVITSWSFLADAEGASVRLKILRPNADGSFSVIGESATETAPPSQQQTFPARIAVRAGDYLGTAAASGKTVAYTGAQTDTVQLAPGDQPVGSTGSYSAVQGIRVDATATIELDADKDGFGESACA